MPYTITLSLAEERELARMVAEASPPTTALAVVTDVISDHIRQSARARMAQTRDVVIARWQQADQATRDQIRTLLGMGPED